MTRHVTPITAGAVIAGQRPRDSFMSRPSPPAGPRSLKVTFAALSVSNARTLSGPEHPGMDAFHSRGRRLDADTFIASPIKAA